MENKYGKKWRMIDKTLDINIGPSYNMYTHM